MPKLPEVASSAELMQRLESSAILKPGELGRAHELARETNSCRLLARRLVAVGLLTRWQVGQLLVGWTRLRLGKYVLLSQMGRGDFGRIFLARHWQLEREVAIQTLSRRFTQRRDIVEQFLADAREVSTLDHRNILHVYDIDSDDNQYYFVTEYVGGVDLQRRVEQQGPLAVAAGVRLLGQVASGLAHAHERGVLHQNLQPSSLVLDDQGGVKIVGMGMGRLAAMRRTLTAAETGEAEPADPAEFSAYRAPEQVVDQQPGDARSDIYALGALAYYGLTGQAPRRAMAGAEAIDLAQLRSDLPEDLATVIRTMMAPDPQDRFSSATDVVFAVQPWFEGPLAAAPLTGPFFAGPADEGEAGLMPVIEPTPADSFSWTPEPTEASWKSRSTDPPRSVEPERESAFGRSFLPIGPAACALLAVIVVLFSMGIVYWRAQLGSETSMSADGGPPIIRPSARAGARDRETMAQPGVSSSSPAPVAATEAGPPVPPETAPDPKPQAETPATNPAAREGDKSPAVSAADTAAPSQAPTVPAPAPPAPEPTASPAPEPTANPAPAPVPPANPAPAPEPTAAPAPAPEPTANPVPAPAPKTEPTPDPAPPTNPFLGLPSAIDLLSVKQDPTVIVSAAPLEVGNLDVAAGATVQVALLGGTQAGTRDALFEVAQSVAASTPTWQFLLIEDQPTGPISRPVGELRFESGQLRFVWDAAASAMANAPYLSNCVVRLTSGGFRHDLRLRTPLAGTPLQVTLKKQPETERVKLPVPPDVKQVRFQVVSLSAPLPQAYTLLPPEPIAVDGANVRIALGENAESPVLLFDLKPGLKTVVEVAGEVSFRVQPSADPVIWSAKKLEQVGRIVATNQELANLEAQRRRTIVTGLAATDPKRPAQEALLRQAEASLAECTKMTQAMTWLVQTRDAVAKGAAVHYRVFSLADDCEVDLVRTDVATP
ncbi:MAG: serine/threonine protein kinase [Pirellulaceae bacterium]